MFDRLIKLIGEDNFNKIQSSNDNEFLKNHRQGIEYHQNLSPLNNIQNEELTFKTSRRDDMWFHVKTIHGSHVILRCGADQPDENSLMLAAAMAVYCSQGRNGGNVAVDYTRIRNIRKIPEALPGRVSYTNYQTVFVRDYQAIFQKNNLHLPVLC